MSHETVSHTKAILGPNIGGLKGRATRKRPHRVVRGRCKITRDFYLMNKFVTLTADVKIVSSIPFLVTLSDSIKYTTAEFIPTRTAGQLANSLMEVVYGYARGGFVVNDVDFKQLIGTKDLKNNPVSYENVSHAKPFSVQILVD